MYWSTFSAEVQKPTFHKVLAAIDSDFSDGSGQGKVKAFWKDFSILDATRTSVIHEKRWKHKHSQSLEKVDSNPLGWLWEVQEDFSGGNNCKCGINRKLELEMEPEDVTELLQCHDKTWVDEKLFLMDEQRGGFLRWNLLLVKMLWRLLKWQQRI